MVISCFLLIVSMKASWLGIAFIKADRKESIGTVGNYVISIETQMYEVNHLGDSPKACCLFSMDEACLILID